MINQIENRPTWSTTTKALILGLVLAALMNVVLAASRPAQAATTFTVNSTGDAGDNSPGDGSCFTGFFISAGDQFFVQECTLRAAIQEANATLGAETINFNIPTTGVATISPASELPMITSPVTVDGYTQPGAQLNTLAAGNNAVLKIQLSGKLNATSTSQGLRIGAANSTVKGLVINYWDYGVRITGSGATGNKVAGNFIGTDASGMQELGNSYYGVYITDAPNNTIGGTMAAERNVISGNDGDGVMILGAAARGNKVMGNYIGTDASGTKDLGNSYYGVYVADAPNNAIGGTTAGARNVISGNGAYGVLFDFGAAGNQVVGNYVGTDKTGTNPLGNSGSGVYITNAPNNTVGGTTAAERNIIPYNGAHGVAIYGNTATGNHLLSNLIFAHVGLGIDVGADGPTANDPGDADSGANDLQNKPIVTSARASATSTTVRGKLNSTPNETFRVQFFSNPTGTDEGKTFVGQKSVTTDASGNVSFTFTPAQKVGVGRTVMATATDPGGNTSEFSAPRTVGAQ